MDHTRTSCLSFSRFVLAAELETCKTSFAHNSNTLYSKLFDNNNSHNFLSPKHTNSMSTTKRKFNALLNGIGNKSTTSLTSSHNNSRVDLNTPTDADSQKRRRISNETSNPLQSSASVRHVTPASRTSTVFLHHKKATTPATASTSQETPKYAPWDRAAFLQRLKSFSNLTDWTPKPARVNEVEWAKRGWVCQKKERVRCCLCNVEIIVKLNKKEVDGKEEPVYVAQNIGTFCHDTSQAVHHDGRMANWR